MLGFKGQERPNVKLELLSLCFFSPESKLLEKHTSEFWWSRTVGPRAPSTELQWRQNLPAEGLGKWKAFCSELIIYNPCWLSMQPLPASSVLSAFVQRLRKHIKDGTSVLCLGESGRAGYPKTEGNVLQISYTWVLVHLMPFMYLSLWNVQREGVILSFSLPCGCT